MYAVDLASGTEIWKFKADKGVADDPFITKSSIKSSASLSGSTLYFGAIDKVIYALDANTGTEIWTYTTLGGVETSPTIHGNTLYVGSNDGHMYALE